MINKSCKVNQLYLYAYKITVGFTLTELTSTVFQGYPLHIVLGRKNLY